MSDGAILLQTWWMFSFVRAVFFVAVKKTGDTAPTTKKSRRYYEGNIRCWDLSGRPG